MVLIIYFMQKLYKFIRIRENIEYLYCLFSILIMATTYTPPFRSLDSVSTWLKGYYYINYFDLGFIKRGLIGSSLKMFNITNYNYPSIFVVTIHAFVTSFIAIIFWKLAKSFFNKIEFKDKVLFYSIFLISPVMFLRTGYDIGRMDAWMLLISLLTMLLISMEYFSFSLISIFMSLSISIQIFIHEASILIYSPFLLGLYWFKFNSNIRSKFQKLIPIFTVPILACLLIFLFGRYENGQTELNLYLKNINNELVGSLPMELTFTIKENINFALGQLTLGKLLGGSYLVTVYYFFIIFISFRSANLPIYLKSICFSPVLLSFIASDTTRFLALSAICTNLLILIAAREGKLIFKQDNRIIIYIFIFSMFILGPWGIGPNDPLPLLKHY